MDKSIFAQRTDAISRTLNIIKDLALNCKTHIDHQRQTGLNYWSDPLLDIVAKFDLPKLHDSLTPVLEEFQKLDVLLRAQANTLSTIGPLLDQEIEIPLNDGKYINIMLATGIKTGYQANKFSEHAECCYCGKERTFTNKDGEDIETALENYDWSQAGDSYCCDEAACGRKFEAAQTGCI